MRASKLGLCVVALSIAAFVTPTVGDAPDCTGISGVFNTDPDLFNELNTVRSPTAPRRA